MPHTLTPTPSRRELAHRVADGIQVRLLWQEDSDTLVVEVLDLFSDDTFEVAVAKDLARYAFEHPYAYAAQEGLDYDHLARRAA